MKNRTIKYLVKNRIKEYREKAGLSRYALDKAIGRAHPYIKDIENQYRQPGLESLVSLCGVLKVAPEDLIYLDFEVINELIKFYTTKK